MAPVMRVPVPVRVVADASCVSRGVARVSSVSTRPALSRRAVLRRSGNGADALDLERVAQIEQEIIRQVRASRVLRAAPCVARQVAGQRAAVVRPCSSAAGHTQGAPPRPHLAPPPPLTHVSHPRGVHSGSKSRRSGTPSPASVLPWRPSRLPWPPFPVRPLSHARTALPRRQTRRTSCVDGSPPSGCRAQRLGPWLPGAGQGPVLSFDPCLSPLALALAVSTPRHHGHPAGGAGRAGWSEHGVVGCQTAQKALTFCFHRASTQTPPSPPPPSP
jgi:hypothetical protein